MAVGTKKILIIDDQLEVRELIAVTLSAPEFTVLRASNGRDGIQIAKKQSPDLILLDISMPQYDGIATCKTLKRDDETKRIPIIFLTARQAREDVRKAIDAGGVDYITKPFSPENLHARVRKVLAARARKSGRTGADG